MFKSYKFVYHTVNISLKNFSKWFGSLACILPKSHFIIVVRGSKWFPSKGHSNRLVWFERKFVTWINTAHQEWPLSLKRLDGCPFGVKNSYVYSFHWSVNILSCWRYVLLLTRRPTPCGPSHVLTYSGPRSIAARDVVGRETKSSIETNIHTRPAQTPNHWPLSSKSEQWEERTFPGREAIRRRLYYYIITIVPFQPNSEKPQKRTFCSQVQPLLLLKFPKKWFKI